MRHSLTLTLMLMLCSGCATMVSRPHETIAVTSEPDGANVSVECGPEKSAHVTPARIPIARTWTDCMVTVEKAGYDKETVVLEQGLNRWTWVNIPIAALGLGILGTSGFSNDPDQGATVGGAVLLVGLGGLLVDGLTGRMRDHDPKTVHVKLRASTPSADAGRDRPPGAPSLDSAFSAQSDPHVPR